MQEAVELRDLLKEVGFKNIKIYPIFKSNFARKLFIKGIANKLKFNIPECILKYIILLYKEKTCLDDTNGIFLVVKCSK